MNQQVNQPPNGTAPAAQIVITLYPNGQIQVSAPLENKMLCHGMIGVALDTIREFKPSDVPAILPASRIAGL
jgi:hypothetical protein